MSNYQLICPSCSSNYIEIKAMKYEFWDDYIIEGTEDYVGLWQIIGRFREKFPQANSQEIKLMTLEATREILETGFMEIGMFEYVDKNNLEYQIWNLDIEGIINRIEREWDELGRIPSLGEIAWLITTKKGEKEAERILKKRKEIDLALFKLLEEILNRPQKQLELDDRLVDDLKIDPDVLSSKLALRIEEELGIKLPVEEWAEVYMIEDLLFLLYEYHHYRT
ncbi:hypothetical protein CYANOKiyG1_04810 [Okeania sp. KiyG1]|nr:hypothetical protein CYANOKiyG1_04810 [Okeania sp. KiyG1]